MTVSRRRNSGVTRPSKRTTTKADADTTKVDSGLGRLKLHLDTSSLSHKSALARMEEYMVPKYLTTVQPPYLSRTSITTRFHVLEMDLFVARPSAVPCSATQPKAFNLMGTGVYRIAKVPENYSVLHLISLSCFLMGWPLKTAWRLWVREFQHGSLKRTAKPQDCNAVEMWLCFGSAARDAFGSSGNQCTDHQRLSAIKLAEVWNPYGIVSNRLGAYSTQPTQSEGDLSIRIRCPAACIQNPHFPIDEPFGIQGVGAPPADYLPRLSGSQRRLQERCETKRFEGWPFGPNFWNFVDRGVVPEVDVEGIHLWRVDSDAFTKRLDVLERRAYGDWLTDIEEHAIEFDPEFHVATNFPGKQ